jgi:tetratricopeptide (TPR) repeat protein
MSRFPQSLYPGLLDCSHPRTRAFRALALALMLICSATVAFAQSSDEDADPVALFERGQDAHARGEFEKAAALYEEAIKLRPEFPEAEYQRATALLSLGRTEDAEKSLRKAVALRPEWSLPNALLGDLLVRQKRLTDAEQPLNQALKLEPRNPTALIALADLRLQAKASRENLLQLLGQLRAATAETNALAGVWIARGIIERALEDTQAALESFEHAIGADSKNIVAYIERAETFASTGDTEHAIETARAAQRIAPSSVYASTALARFYLQAGNCAEATRTLDESDAATKRTAETASLRSRITTQCSIGSGGADNDRPALEAALANEPRNARLNALLCVMYRKDDPQRALDFCRRALEIEPHNVDYGTAYGAALVQARRFAEAVGVLSHITIDAPNNYAAHANLAIALYELQSFRSALAEYRWILDAKPETTAAYFFIATAHDKLGELPEALAAYEAFLAHADPQQFKLEIDKVNLRLPGLRDQIKLGQGKKKKP